VKLYTIPELAEMLKCDRLWLYKLAARGKLPAVRIGRLVRVPEPWLLQWMEENAGRRPNGNDKGGPAETTEPIGYTTPLRG